MNWLLQNGFNVVSEYVIIMFLFMVLEVLLQVKACKFINTACNFILSPGTLFYSGRYNAYNEMYMYKISLLGFSPSKDIKEIEIDTSEFASSINLNPAFDFMKSLYYSLFNET